MPHSNKQWKRLECTTGPAWNGDIEAMAKLNNIVMSRKGYTLHDIERSGKLPNGKERIVFVYVK